MPDFMEPGRYIEKHYEPGDWLCAVILYRDDKGQAVSNIKHEFARTEDMASPRRQAHFRAANAHGADIYLGVNAMVPGTRHRKKEDVQEVRHLYLDVDANGPAVLESVMGAKDLPKPSVVLSSSPGKYQILWRVEGFGKDQAEAAVRGLAAQHGADEAVWDCARILRLLGYRNNKYSEIMAWVREVPGERSQGILTPADFPQFPELERQLAHREGRKIDSGHHSRSEQDWGRVLRKLERNEDPQAIKAWLAQERPDKPNPLYYAERTVKRALEFRQQHSSPGHSPRR